MAPFNTICDLIANRFPPRFDGLSRPLWLSAISANLVARITLLTRPSFAIGCDVPSSQEFERTFNRSCFRAPREVVLGISGFRISESSGFVVSQGVSRFSREGRETFRGRGPIAVFAQGLAVFFAVAMRPDVLGAAGEQGHLRSATSRQTIAYRSPGVSPKPAGRLLLPRDRCKPGFRRSSVRKVCRL